MSDSGQRTEKPTQKRLEKARQEGRFAISRDLSSGVQFAAFVVCLGWAVPEWVSRWRVQSRALVEGAAHLEMTPASVSRVWRDLTLATVAPLAWPAFAVAAAAIAAQLTMTRFGFALSRIGPDVTRLNGFPRLADLPKQALPQLGQMMLMFAALSIALNSIRSQSFCGCLSRPRARSER